MAGSINMKRSDLEFTVKRGGLNTLTFTHRDQGTGCVVALCCASTYNTGTWKVWEPDGTIVFCGSIVYSCRAAGQVTYTLIATDICMTCDAGIWEGEVEFIDCMCGVIDKGRSFTFTVQESF